MKTLLGLSTALSLVAAPAIGGDQVVFVCPPGKTEVTIHFNPDDGEGGKLYFYINGKQYKSSLFRADGKKGTLFYRGKRCKEDESK